MNPSENATIVSDCNKSHKKRLLQRVSDARFNLNENQKNQYVSYGSVVAAISKKNRMIIKMYIARILLYIAQKAQYRAKKSFLITFTNFASIQFVLDQYNIFKKFFIGTKL